MQRGMQQRGWKRESRNREILMLDHFIDSKLRKGRERRMRIPKLEGGIKGKSDAKWNEKDWLKKIP